MKITLYIRAPKRTTCTMHTRIEEEANYDSVRVINLANEIKQAIDDIIENCKRLGYIEYGKYTKQDKTIQIEKSK